jgi:hypothetical protein
MLAHLRGRAAFFQPRAAWRTGVVPSAIAAAGIGFVLGFRGDEFPPGVFFNTLPLPVVAGVVAAIL